MKILFFVLTVVVQFSILIPIRLLDNLNLIAAMFAISLTAGFYLMYLGDTIKPTLKNLGWGLRYGSLFSIISLLVFLWWFSNNLPK